jgi:hypothetical protein
MGNRAIIQTKQSHENEGLGVYLHWNGGYDSVSAFLKYCELKGYRTPDTDSYGWARLCQVIGNYFGGGLSLGIDNFSKDAGEWQDNGTYIIEGWKIVDRKYYDYEEQNNYDLVEMLLDIDAAQPKKERLGADFIMAKEVSVKEVNIGDIVYVANCDANYNQYKVIGFGDGMVNGIDMTEVPYVELYGDEESGYAWNCNNYLRTETVRVAKAV